MRTKERWGRVRWLWLWSFGALAPVCAALALVALPAAAHAEGCPDEQARQKRGSTSLPDCRAYELVTPPQKNGALIGATFSQHPWVARGDHGQRVIAPSFQCFATPESCVPLRVTGEPLGVPYEFARTGAGWVTHPLAPPASFETDSWWSVSADLGTALFSMPSPPEGQDDFYARQPGGSLTAVGAFGENAVAELHLGKGSPADDRAIAKEGVIATADLSHVVYETTAPLWSFDTSGPEEASGLYEYVAGDPAPLMVAVGGGYENGKNHKLISLCGAYLGGKAEGAQRRIGSLSEDGRTVYFAARGHDEATCEESTAAPTVTGLYARVDGELPAARTVLVSAPTPGVCTEPECEENTSKANEEADARAAEFEGASADGSHAFFTDTQQLTNGASESSGKAFHGCSTIEEPGCNLYESECPHCDELTEAQELATRHLVDVSEGVSKSDMAHGGPRVQGVLATSADGSHVYFIAKGKLTGADTVAGRSPETAEPQEEADNLYVYGEGHLAFITSLSSSDEREWELGSSNAFAANATPDGRFLVFTSHRALTPDDTRGEKVGEEAEAAQVFEYDAQTQTLKRISIGEKGFNANGNSGVGDASIAAVSTVAGAGTVPVRSDPTMSDDGAFVFFQSPLALAPGALNDAPITGENPYAENVYEYHEGQVYLISDGKDTSPKPSEFKASPVELLGSDASGKNVFFATFDRLVPEDVDTQRDFYDAHVCGEQEEEACIAPAAGPPPPCTEGSCQGAAPTAPSFGAPSSATFFGAGNLTPPAPPKPKTAAQVRAEKLAKALKACRKDKKKSKRTTCERQARKRYAVASKARKAKSAGANRRAGR